MSLRVYDRDALLVERRAYHYHTLHVRYIVKAERDHIAEWHSACDGAYDESILNIDRSDGDQPGLSRELRVRYQPSLCLKQPLTPKAFANLSPGFPTLGSQKDDAFRTP